MKFRVLAVAHGRGKSGGVRVIYYFFDEQNPLYALFLYGKNAQTDLTSEQKKEFAAFSARIKATAKIGRREP